MPIKLSPATIKAISSLVITLDRHRFGALALAIILLAAGVSVAIARA